MMKGTGRRLTVALVLAVAGGICLATGIVNRELARAQEQIFALDYAESAAAFATAERYLTYGRWIPPVGRRLDEVRVRRAALDYWEREYDRIVPPGADPLVGIPPENVDQQLLAANASFRRSQPTAKDRVNTLRTLDAAINAYLGVLRNGGGNETAAYNYEYLVRVREDVDKGRRAPELTDNAEDGPAGEQGGAPPADSNKRDLKILIPLEPGEMDKAIEPGKGTPIERKG